MCGAVKECVSGSSERAGNVKKRKKKKVEQVDSRKSFEMSLGFLLILALCQTFRFNLCILKKLLDATRQTCVTLRSDSVNL